MEELKTKDLGAVHDIKIKIVKVEGVVAGDGGKQDSKEEGFSGKLKESRMYAVKGYSAVGEVKGGDEARRKKEKRMSAVSPEDEFLSFLRTLEIVKGSEYATMPARGPVPTFVADKTGRGPMMLPTAAAARCSQ